MGVENYFSDTIVWNFDRLEDFTLDYDFIDRVFSEQARKEGYLEPKQYIKIKSLTGNNVTRQMKIEAEIFKFLEN